MIEQLGKESFDHILLLNCLEQIYHHHSLTLIYRLRRSLTKDGKLIIIHRDVTNNTLPVPSEVIDVWQRKSPHLLLKLIEHLQRYEHQQIDSFQEIRTMKFLMKKSDWFSLLFSRSFYPLNLINEEKVGTMDIL